MRILNFLNRQEPPRAEKMTVFSGERSFELAIVRHPRARRYTIRVRDAHRDVVLTMPRRGNLADAHTFAQKNAAWIASKLARLPDIVPFADGEIIPLRGVPHRISHRPHARGSVWTELDESGNALLCVAGSAAHVARRVTDFLKREAKKALAESSRKYATRIGVVIGRIGLRDSISRWGSCSESGSLSYSWRLILAPDFVLDYLSAHEVAHRIELNHSGRFWALLDSMTPDRERAEGWLAAQGNSLHRYGKARIKKN
jgi:predicted metal-dependent hydrolase